MSTVPSRRSRGGEAEWASSLDGGFGAILESFAVPVAVHRRGVLLAANRACVELIGAPDAAALLGKHVAEFVTADSRASVEECTTEAPATRAEVTSAEIPTADGNALNIAMVSLPVLFGGEAASMLVVRDRRREERREEEHRQLREAAETARDEQRRSEEALRLAEEAAGVGAWDWEVATGQLSWTEGLEPLHGLDRGEFKGTFEHFLELIDQRDRGTVLHQIETALREGPDDFETDFRVHHKDGSTHWVLGKGRVLRDADGRPLRMVGIGLDVTERRELREQLSLALQQLRLVFDSLPDPVAYIDADRRIRFASQAFQQLFGKSSSELEGRRVRDIVGDRQYAAIARFADQALSGQPVSFQLEVTKARIGRPRLLQVTFVPHRSADGAVLGYISVSRDATEERRAERSRELIGTATALFSTSLDYETTLASVAEVMIPGLAEHCIIDVVEIDGTLRRVAAQQGRGETDPAMRELGERVPRYGPEDPRGQVLATGQAVLFPAVGRAFLARLVTDEAHLALFEALRPASAVVAPICVGREPFGVMLLLRQEPSPPYDELDRQTAEELGRRAGTAIANARIFGQVQEAAGALSEANAAKDEFLALVSHELRTPLTTISGNADILLRASSRLSDEEREQALTDIKTDAQRLRSLVENMLTLSHLGRDGRAEVEPILPMRIVEDIVNVYRVRFPTRRFDLVGSSSIVMAERSCLEQIMENLLSNAVRYSPMGAPIEVRVERGGDHVAITVADRGRGITQQEPVFEAFYRSRDASILAPGLGLGLTVCKRLVEAQGGEIVARSREGGGSEFAFTLPALADVQEG